MSKKLLPFSLMPGAWGLKGKTKEIAQAEYELEGYDLARKLLEINKSEYDDREFTRRCIEIDYKFGKCNQHEYLRHLSNLIEDEVQRKIAYLELDLKEGKITELSFQKESATLHKEPWVTVINMDFGGSKSLEGSFELDWNSFFVEKLISEGYTGPAPDAIVNSWFMEVCRNVALEEFDGQGDFTADSQANLETMKRWNSTQPTTDGKRIHK